MKIKELETIAFRIRKNIILSLTAAQSGHLGGSLGLADIFTALYFNILKHQAKNPNWKERDRLILSIGHVAPVLYASLAEAGYFDISELMSLRKMGSRLQGHPSIKENLPGIELAAGSLGQGLSVSVGLALAFKMDKKTNTVYCILGDGELQEGSVWEAAMSASQHQLNNIIAIVDRNYVQIDGATEKVMRIAPLEEKWIAFGWNVLSCNGNDINDFISTVNQAKINSKKPNIIIAETKMSKGIPSIEGDYRWHGKVPSEEEKELFLKELENIK